MSAAGADGVAAGEPGPLAGIRVLDLADTVASQYCGRLFADYGADSVLVEPTGGSRIRRSPSWTGPRAFDADSALFRHLNAGKRSVELDWATRSGAEVLDDLAATADVVLTCDEDTARRLCARHASLVCCWFSDFGHGPLADWHGAEIVFQALSGVMLLNGSHPRKPLYGIGQRAQYSAGIAAYDTVIAALFYRGVSGRGQFVEVAVLDAVAAMNGPVAARYLYNGTVADRASSAGLTGLLRCRDSWIVLYAARPDDWRGCCEVFGLPELAADPRFAELTTRLSNWPAAMELLGARAAAMTAGEVIAAGRACKLPVSRVMTADALELDEHLTARGFWISGADDSRRLAPPLRFSGSALLPAAGFPASGQADQEILVGESLVTESDFALLQSMGIVR